MREGSWTITGSAIDDALQMGFDEEDAFDCIVNYLEETHFYKTMEAQKVQGLMQDVYHITYQVQRVYIKLQVTFQAVVVSFRGL